MAGFNPTGLSEIVYNTAFASYFQRAITERSALIQSGIAVSDPNIAALCSEAGFGGKTVNLPYWNTITGDDEVLKDNGDLVVNPITAGQDVAVILRRGKAWGAGDLAREIAGDDPIKTVADKLADYWGRRQQATLFSQLLGIFAGNAAGNAGDLILDISSESGDDALLAGDSLLFAAQLLGDAKQNLTAIAMHSMCETVLNANNNGGIFKPGDTPAMLPTYNARKIVMDDSCSYNPNTKVADIYLFGAGAVAMNDCPITNPLETDRRKLAGTDIIITRRAWISHLRGIKWGGTPAGASPTNAELEAAGNWTRVYDKKDIRVVKLRCKLAV